MAVTLNLTRFAGDTDNMTLRFYTDAARTTALSLSGRTFAAHVENGSGTDVLAFTSISPSGASSNELLLTPTTGAWTDLVLGTTYVWSLWETTGGVTATLFSGRMNVSNR